MDDGPFRDITAPENQLFIRSLDEGRVPPGIVLNLVHIGMLLTLVRRTEVSEKSIICFLEDLILKIYLSRYFLSTIFFIHICAAVFMYLHWWNSLCLNTISILVCIDDTHNTFPFCLFLTSRFSLPFNILPPLARQVLLALFTPLFLHLRMSSFMRIYLSLLL